MFSSQLRLVLYHIEAQEQEYFFIVSILNFGTLYFVRAYVIGLRVHSNAVLVRQYFAVIVRIIGRDFVVGVSEAEPLNVKLLCRLAYCYAVCSLVVYRVTCFDLICSTARELYFHSRVVSLKRRHKLLSLRNKTYRKNTCLHF
jgi:hypothetical protein